MRPHALLRKWLENLEPGRLVSWFEALRGVDPYARYDDHPLLEAVIAAGLQPTTEDLDLLKERLAGLDRADPESATREFLWLAIGMHLARLFAGKLRRQGEVEIADHIERFEASMGLYQSMSDELRRVAGIPEPHDPEDL